MTDRHPHLRPREILRDMWLVAISIIVVLALLSANHAISQIQASRLAACQVQNQRHGQTIRTLDRELARYERHATPARRLQIESSRAFTVALISALVPQLDCARVVLHLSAHH